MSKAGDRAYAEIKAQILSGALVPGAQLKEEVLSEICGVSRTPVRAAMHRLEAEMFIQRTDRQRSFVSDWSIADVEELFTLRTMLESYAAGRAAERATPTVLAALQRNVLDISAAIAGPLPNVDAFMTMNAEFHSLILQAAASDRLAHMIDRLVLQPIVHRTALRYNPEQLRQSLAEHNEIVAALEAHDPDWASAIMTSHIRRAFHVYRSKKFDPVNDRPDTASAKRHAK